MPPFGFKKKIEQLLLFQNQNSYGKVTIRAGLGWISYILGSNTANAAAAILPNMERHCPKHPDAEVRIWTYTYGG